MGVGLGKLVWVPLTIFGGPMSLGVPGISLELGIFPRDFKGFLWEWYGNMVFLRDFTHNAVDG